MDGQMYSSDYGKASVALGTMAAESIGTQKLETAGLC
jgi:hypothetical protein